MRHMASGPQSTLLNRDEDYLAEQGARQLAARIRAYWERKGKAVTVWTEAQEQSASSADNRVMYIVRSDMKGGQPCA